MRKKASLQDLAETEHRSLLVLSALTCVVWARIAHCEEDRLRSPIVERGLIELLLARDLQKASRRGPATGGWAGQTTSRNPQTVAKVESCAVLEAEMRAHLG